MAAKWAVRRSAPPRAGRAVGCPPGRMQHLLRCGAGWAASAVKVPLAGQAWGRLSAGPKAEGQGSKRVLPPPVAWWPAEPAASLQRWGMAEPCQRDLPPRDHGVALAGLADHDRVGRSADAALACRQWLAGVQVRARIGFRTRTQAGATAVRQVPQPLAKDRLFRRPRSKAETEPSAGKRVPRDSSAGQGDRPSGAGAAQLAASLVSKLAKPQGARAGQPSAMAWAARQVEPQHPHLRPTKCPPTAHQPKAWLCQPRVAMAVGMRAG